MEDPTITALRMEATEAVNSVKGERELLEEKYGQVWDTDQLRADFEVLSFLAPCISVIRKSDNKKGVMMFQHDPRYYFNFTPS